MLRLLTVAMAVVSAAGCRCIAHSVERVEVEERRILSEEDLGESWGGRTALHLEAQSAADGLRFTAHATESGVRRVRVTEKVTLRLKCARRAVGGIFEAPDSVMGVADDIWVGTAFAALALSHAVRKHDGSSEALYVSGALFLLGAAQVALDALSFIPWWIAGHDWSGACDYVSEESDLGERTEEREIPIERVVPYTGPISVLIGSGKDAAVARIACGPDGAARASMRDLVAWTRGRSGPVRFEIADGSLGDAATVKPGDVLNGLLGSRVDWGVREGGAAPELEARAEVQGRTLVVRVTNRGPGDAWQVAVIVAAASPELDGRVAALGRVRSGETVDARISLPAGVTQGAVDFSEASGRAPRAVPFGK